MKDTQFTLTTLKEMPSDAEIISHQLLIKGGVIRKLASGIYSWMPLGLRVLRKVETIVREEMDRSGAQELLMPVTQPGELWEESGRWKLYDEGLLLKFKDRHDRDFCLGPTHEEVITYWQRSPRPGQSQYRRWMEGSKSQYRLHWPPMHKRRALDSQTRPSVQWSCVRQQRRRLHLNRKSR